MYPFFFLRRRSLILKCTTACASLGSEYSLDEESWNLFIQDTTIDSHRLDLPATSRSKEHRQRQGRSHRSQSSDGWNGFAMLIERILSSDLRVSLTRSSSSRLRRDELTLIETLFMIKKILSRNRERLECDLPYCVGRTLHHTFEENSLDFTCEQIHPRRVPDTWKSDAFFISAHFTASSSSRTDFSDLVVCSIRVFFPISESAMPVKVYMTNITSNQLTIGNQRKLRHIFDTHKIDYTDIDISDPKYTPEKEFLQHALASVQKKLNLPQIFHEEHYCGDFDDLLAAVESNTLKEFLQLNDHAENHGHWQRSRVRYLSYILLPFFLFRSKSTAWSLNWISLFFLSHPEETINRRHVNKIDRLTSVDAL